MVHRALERERKARVQAERLLEEKSLELYRAQQILKLRVSDLEKLNKELTDSQIRLVQAEKLASLGSLVAGVGHEINNPVGFVVSNLTSLQEYGNFLSAVVTAYDKHRRARSTGDAAAIEAAEAALDLALAADDVDFIITDLSDLTTESLTGMKRIKAIVDALRTFSRADDPEPTFYDLNDAVLTAIHIIGGELRNKCQIETNLGTLPKISCFPGQINQVILNLLVNAADAVEQEGVVTVATSSGNNRVCIEVKDSGCGIDAKHLNRIYDPFFTTKPVGKGTGLGLAITYDIIQAHGGDIEVQSEIGTGTTFSVSLPICNQ
jgi:signal transduction histidine kinase